MCVAFAVCVALLQANLEVFHVATVVLIIGKFTAFTSSLIYNVNKLHLVNTLNV